MIQILNNDDDHEGDEDDDGDDDEIGNGEVHNDYFLGHRCLLRQTHANKMELSRRQS